MMFLPRIHSIILVFLFLAPAAYSQFYNGSHNDFGKNRIQYDDFKWQYIRQSNFDVYYYEGGKELAEYIVRVASVHIPQVENYFDYYFSDKLQFILYNKLSHFHQSNAGIVDEENYNTGGVVKIFGNKIFLYFNGNHRDLEEQIKAGIAEVLLNEIIYGDNWREVLKNSTLLSLPEWYMKGLISYLSRPWDWRIENMIRDGFLNNKFKSFNKLSGEQAIVAGHSLWYFIAQSYGSKNIPNIIAMTRLTKSIESGFLYVLGLSTKTLTKEWITYFEEYYQLEQRKKKDKEIEPLPVKKTGKKNLDYQQISYNPDLHLAAYVTHKMGKYKIWIHDLHTQKRYKIYKGGIKLDRINDNSLPILKWHPNQKTLVFITERKGELLIHFYDSETGIIDQKPLFNLEKVLSLDISPNGKEIVFSAFNKGQTDLYLYNSISNSQKPLTLDVFDDLFPAFSADGKYIFFVSNRTHDTLKKNVPNLYYPSYQRLYRLSLNELKEKKESVILQPVDKDPFGEKLQPMGTDSGLYYLKENNQYILSLYFARYDSVISFIDTAIHYRYFYVSRPLAEFPFSIRQYEIKNHQLLFFRTHKWRTFLYTLDLAHIMQSSSPETTIKETQKNLSEQILPHFTQPLRYPIIDTTAIDYNQYLFGNQTYESNGLTVSRKVITIEDKKQTSTNKKENNPLQGKTSPSGNDTLLTINKPRVYFLSFFTDESITQLNNNFVNGQYQIFNGGPFISPGLGAVMKMGISDIFEDYKVYGGVRFGTSSMEYFMGYQNLKHRLDKEMIFTRRTNRAGNEFSTYQFITNEAAYNLVYPFSPISSIRTTFKLRHDNIVTKANESFSLRAPDFHDFWSTFKIAYVFDNTQYVMLNIMHGTRLKIWGEYLQQLQKNDEKFYYVFSSVPAFDKQHYNTFVAGLDIRHYQKIHRELTFITRLAGGTSWGKQKLIHYLGSVDDWIILGKTERFNRNQEIDYTQNYRFQTLASPLRGFNQNIRNGNSFAVINTEIRWPVFKYFIRRPIKSSLVSNFQVVGFGDIGSAWNGWNPFSEENAINRKIITDGPITIVLYDSTHPIVGGYGFGMRTRLLGYFIRTDWAWGVVDGKIQKPMFYLSLCLDI